MNQAKAINEALKRLPIDADSRSIFEEANKIIEEHSSMVKRMNEFNSLSAKRVKMQMSDLQSNYQVIRLLLSSTIVEFLGEEFWLSLNTTKEKLIAKDVYEKIRKRFEQA